MSVQMIFLLVEYGALFLAALLLSCTFNNDNTNACLRLIKASSFLGLIGFLAGGSLYITDTYSNGLIFSGGYIAILAGFTLSWIIKGD